MILLFDSSRMKHSDVKVVKFSLGGDMYAHKFKVYFPRGGQSNIDVLLRHNATFDCPWQSRSTFCIFQKDQKDLRSRNVILGLGSLFLYVSSSCRLSLILLIHFGPSPVCIIQAHSIAYILALLYLTSRRRSPCNF
jgi:hypothetical protein